jgi:hypothetical protein
MVDGGMGTQSGGGRPGGVSRMNTMRSQWEGGEGTVMLEAPQATYKRAQSYATQRSMATHRSQSSDVFDETMGGQSTTAQHGTRRSFSRLGTIRSQEEAGEGEGADPLEADAQSETSSVRKPSTESLAGSVSRQASRVGNVSGRGGEEQRRQRSSRAPSVRRDGGGGLDELEAFREVVLRRLDHAEREIERLDDAKINKPLAGAGPLSPVDSEGSVEVEQRLDTLEEQQRALERCMRCVDLSMTGGTLSDVVYSGRTHYCRSTGGTCRCPVSVRSPAFQP